LDRIFDRLGKVLRSWLRSAPDNTSSATDPHMQEAWDELNTYLNGEEGFRSQGSSRNRSQDDDTRRRNEHVSQGEIENLRKDYTNLEVSFGASFDQVKRSYKKLLRRYQPNRHFTDPEKLKLATEITMKINESYNRIKSKDGTSKDQRSRNHHS